MENLYDELREKCFPDLPEDYLNFETGFSREQINKACVVLKINAFIYECVIMDGIGKTAGLLWKSTQAEGNVRLNMVEHEGHLMFIKKIKSLFKKF